MEESPCLANQPWRSTFNLWWHKVDCAFFLNRCRGANPLNLNTITRVYFRKITTNRLGFKLVDILRPCNHTGVNDFKQTCYCIIKGLWYRTYLYLQTKHSNPLTFWLEVRSDVTDFKISRRIEELVFFSALSWLMKQAYPLSSLVLYI